MKFPFIGKRDPVVSLLPGISVKKSELNWLRNEVVELNRLQDIRDNLQNELWPPAIWKLVSLADTFVLGKWGIYPRFNEPRAYDEWSRYRVDDRRRLSVRKFLRVVLAQLIVHNEAFMRLDAGTLSPLPRPYHIDYEEDRVTPRQYQWSNPRPMTLPASEVWHIMVEWTPVQLRGNSTLWVLYDILNDRRNFLKSVVKMAKNAARVSLFHKRNRGNILAHPDMDENEAKTKSEQTFDFDEDTFLEVGPSDEITNVSQGSFAVPPSEIDRLVMGTVGQRVGLSRMAVQGDFADATYSSARFADMNDHGVWNRLQSELLEVVEYLYDQWPGRLAYDGAFQGMFIPPFPYIDPARTASVNSQLVAMKAKSVQQVIREEGQDPDTVFAEIEAFNQRFPEQAQPGGGGFGAPIQPRVTQDLEWAYVDN